MTCKKDKGSFTLESGLIIPLIMITAALFISLMITFTFETVRSVNEAFAGKSVSEYVEEAETDIFLNTIFDFVEEF